MGKVLRIIYRIISTYLIKKAGHNKKTARTGAVTLIQRFGGALNLNIHFHMLFLDGVYVDDVNSEGGQRFVPVSNHTVADITRLAHNMSVRVARFLARVGLIEADAEAISVVEGVSVLCEELVPCFYKKIIAASNKVNEFNAIYQRENNRGCLQFTSATILIRMPTRPLMNNFFSIYHISWLLHENV
jgi:hypothetical protein